MDLINTQSIKDQLSSLKSKDKFTSDESPFYPGAPDEKARLSAQAAIDGLISNLLATPDSELNSSKVFELFIAAASPLQKMDSEELERGLEYMENIMDIYGIESSNGLLNELRYGFNPK